LRVFVERLALFELRLRVPAPLGLRLVAVFALPAFGLTFDAAAVVTVVAFVFLVVREAGRAFARGAVAAFVVSPSADSAASTASPGGDSRGLLVFTGCQVCGEPNALCLRNSRAASS
jgi:hypothetical protein